MKRLNPETGKPFKCGDTRSDGFIFAQYKMTIIKRNGYYQEVWDSPKTAKKRQHAACCRSKTRALSIHGRSTKLRRSAIERCVKRKAGEVTITQQWILERLSRGCCELTGLPFDLSPPSNGDSRNPYAPSLDRIDNKNPNYSPENTRVVLSSVNSALNEYTFDVIIPILKTLVEKAV